MKLEATLQEEKAKTNFLLKEIKDNNEVISVILTCTIAAICGAFFLLKMETTRLGSNKYSDRNCTRITISQNFFSSTSTNLEHDSFVGQKLKDSIHSEYHSIAGPYAFRIFAVTD